MPSVKTEVTEIVTGLATLGFKNIQHALHARPAEMLNVKAEHWHHLDGALAGGDLAREFDNAWANGRAFRRADYGLRGRPPKRVEWKGPHQPPGFDLIPADLRIDHVFLLSCKYWSNLLFNASPSHLFERALAARHPRDPTDWFLKVAPTEYVALYRAVRQRFPELTLPASVGDLRPKHRSELKGALSGRWPLGLESAYRDLARSVGRESARIWNAILTTKGAREEMLWRLLRLASAPYFVLGSQEHRHLRLRIMTPWDWRQTFHFDGLEVWGDESAAQPVVRWRALVQDLDSDVPVTVDGHVEVRWSHGRFKSNPEAKVYLDSRHDSVPGYWPLSV